MVKRIHLAGCALAIALLLGVVAASAIAGPSAEARRPMPRATPASVYTEATTPRVRVDASAVATTKRSLLMAQAPWLSVGPRVPRSVSWPEGRS